MNGNTKISDLTVDEFVSLMREIRQDQLESSSGRRHVFPWQQAGYGHPQGCDCNPCCSRRAHERDAAMAGNVSGMFRR